MYVIYLHTQIQKQSPVDFTWLRLAANVIVLAILKAEGHDNFI